MNDYTLISWDGDLTHNEHVKIFIKKSAIFRKSLFKKTCQIKIFAFFGEIYFHCTIFSMLGHSCTTLSNQQPKKISDLYQKFKIVRKNSLFTKKCFYLHALHMNTFLYLIWFMNIYCYVYFWKCKTCLINENYLIIDRKKIKWTHASFFLLGIEKFTSFDNILLHSTHTI